MNGHYEAVIGLEVHVELKTESKIFCSCPVSFGAPANSCCCPVCLGLPGTLPVLNRKVIELGVMAGLALGCEISHRSQMDRKHYFYPDLPKGYQISQDARPLCKNGSLEIEADGEKKVIRISRIHIEEDAGKMLHQNGQSLVDYNRSGIPLLEIVSAPVLRSGAQAAAYLKALRSILVACGISDCKMQEGSMRCDVNLSLRPVGENTFGVRTEIKNINSFSFVEKAIAYELQRQTELLERGEKILPQTRRYQESTGKTVLMRTKETTADYRYLEEPDLPPILLTEEEIEALRRRLPELPAHRRERFCQAFGLEEQTARSILSDVALADYFEETAKSTAHPRIAAHLLLNHLLHLCGEGDFSCPVVPARLAELADLFGEERINSTTAKKLLERLMSSDFSPKQVAEKEQLLQLTDEALLREVIQSVLNENQQAVADYQKGKKAAMQSLLGRVMAKTKGRAHPKIAEQLLKTALYVSSTEIM